MKFKNVVTLTALMSFAALIISAVLASLFDLWETLIILHVSLSILFGICYITQTSLEMKKENSNNRITGKKRDWLTVNSYTALLLTAWVILGSLFHWPPFGLAPFAQRGAARQTASRFASCGRWRRSVRCFNGTRPRGRTFVEQL